MKKVILTSVLLAGLAATSAFAYKGNCQMQGDNQGCNKSQMQKDCGMKGEKRFHKGMKRGGFNKGGMMFSQLDLSDEQKYQMSILRDEMRLEMKKEMGMKKRGQMQKFITADGFDKDAFIKDSNERHQKMTELRAKHMEKVLALLTKEQIAKLQTIK